jgi:altronate dehydratase
MSQHSQLLVHNHKENIDVRNHVVIPPLDDISNAACETIANNIKSAMALPYANGRNTAAEAPGHREFVMTKLYRSASGCRDGRSGRNSQDSARPGQSA